MSEATPKTMRQAIINGIGKTTSVDVLAENIEATVKDYLSQKFTVSFYTAAKLDNKDAGKLVEALWGKIFQEKSDGQ